MRYRFDPQLKQEKALAAQIHDALEGDVIDQVMEYTGCRRAACGSGVQRTSSCR